MSSTQEDHAVRPNARKLSCVVLLVLAWSPGASETEEKKSIQFSENHAVECMSLGHAVLSLNDLKSATADNKKKKKVVITNQPW